MDAFVWDQRYMTGEAQVDGEHQELVRIINALIDLQSKYASPDAVAQVLDQLVNYAVVHFAHEEALMAESHCDPRFVERHVAVHRSFAEQVVRLRDSSADGSDLEYLLNFLTSWLAQHILGMDKAMVRQIELIRGGNSPQAAYDAAAKITTDPATSSMLDAMASLYRIISARNDALSELNRGLEAKVAERTEALKESNRRLLESEHRRSTETRRNLELFLSQIIDGDPVPTLVIDASHRITHWNKACANISGLPAERMVGTWDQWMAFYPAARPIMADLIVDGSLEERFNTYYHNLFRRSKTIEDAFEAESFFPNLGENGRWLFFTAAPIRDGEGRIIGAIETLQDVTDRHLAEDELLKYQEQLEAQVEARTRELASTNRQLEREHAELTTLLGKIDETQQQLLQSEKMAAIGQLAAGVAHEINNPVGFVNSNLGSLKSYTGNLLRLIDAYESGEPQAIAAARQAADLEFLREDLPSLLAESQEGLDRVTRIVQDLKDFSRVDQAEHQRADLNAAMNSTLNVVRNELKYKADVIVELGDIPEIDCVPAQLNQVFMNLLVNAAQAIPERGKIFVRSGVERDHVWFEIEDTGCGMSAETRQRIFEPFFTTKPVGKGTGLGLSISYDIIVKRHHGRLDVHSETGKGTTFRIWLPIVQSAET
ncbi:bacteriohemerythrin [Azonexus hydrophilus]|uniref:bacteriohemerythrin n=1 Tax=Azonexus hydrophilus TaxID=418702 RepID=UPI0024921C2A|nr:bacteriohemerythrin [Azonexus hydrophilus]